jgi:3-dehydroquinate synthase
MSSNFSINNTILSYEVLDFPFTVKSFPNPYQVSTINSTKDYQRFLADADFVIIDVNVGLHYEPHTPYQCVIFRVRATEENKCMETVLKLIDALIVAGISKGSKVVAIGGGIIQDLAACACALFRRGQPFTYLPTTTLGQLDSCVGAKCAINTDLAKNIIGLFSAPREVIIPTFMIQTVGLSDHRAGLSEMLRLCLTASSAAVDEYISLFKLISCPSSLDLPAYVQALTLSLSIKKSVVDYDEYETDVRRSMNFGHTFGHAIEKLVNFSLPHGLGVLVGIQMANEFAYLSGMMDHSMYTRLCKPVQMTISGVHLGSTTVLGSLTPEAILDQFKYDKKGDGSSVPLILLKSPGDMIFYRYSFDSPSSILIDSISKSLVRFNSWLQK